MEHNLTLKDGIQNEVKAPSTLPLCRRSPKRGRGGSRAVGFDEVVAGCGGQIRSRQRTHSLHREEGDSTDHHDPPIPRWCWSAPGQVQGFNSTQQWVLDNQPGEPAVIPRAFVQEFQGRTRAPGVDGRSGLGRSGWLSVNPRMRHDREELMHARPWNGPALKPQTLKRGR
jgi:hypothetical protein